MTVFVTFVVPPLQPIVPADKDVVRAFGSVIVADDVAEQPRLSVIVTV